MIAVALKDAGQISDPKKKAMAFRHIAVAQAKVGDVKTVLSSITYLQNQKERMNYSYSVKRNWPIGSGVTEAACKTLIKHRLCKSGSRWKDDGALAVLSIRALRLTTGRWEELWRNSDQYGCPTLLA